MAPKTWRVLVIDADTDVRSVVEDLLFDQGFAVCQAANAYEAAQELDKEVFDVLLCHVSMLRSDGAFLGRCIRELDPIPRVVAMSASGSLARGDEASANLAKPFTRSQLLETLRPD